MLIKIILTKRYDLLLFFVTLHRTNQKMVLFKRSFHGSIICLEG